MNRKVKRIFSFVMAAIMIFVLNATAYAGDYKTSSFKGANEMPDGSVILQISDSSNSYIKGYEVANGNTVLEQYTNGKITSKYTVQKGKNIINATYYDSGSTTYETINTTAIGAHFNGTPKGTTSGRLGRIRFQYTSGDGKGICGAYVDYVKNTGSIKYDITGTYKDLAALAAFIISICATPLSAALNIGKAVLGALGFGLTATYFFIPSYYLQSSYEEIEYDLCFC